MDDPLPNPKVAAPIVLRIVKAAFAERDYRIAISAEPDRAPSEEFMKGMREVCQEMDAALYEFEKEFYGG